MKKRIAILGSGKIACDLLKKIIRSPYLSCEILAGRNASSEGISYARGLGIMTSYEGIDIILKNINSYDIIFDATSAYAHLDHNEILKDYHKTIINLTPARIGSKCIPAVSLNHVRARSLINMVTCGGQAAIPIITTVSELTRCVEYVEVVSTIAAASAGPATRLNMCEYLENTEAAIHEFSASKRTKVILNINPANPPINMQTTIYILMKDYCEQQIRYSISSIIDKVKLYAPGYELLHQPIFEGDKLTVMLKICGQGDYLPKYAGNLDIITSASVRVAEYIAQN